MINYIGLSAEVAVDEFLANCVDIPKFIKCCQACPNYGSNWGCPPFDFDVEAFWRRYSSLLLYGAKIPVPDEMRAQTYEGEALISASRDLLAPVKARLADELLAMERACPGSVMLSAGSCRICESGCARKEGKPCRCSERMRHSIESLGGDVGLTLKRYLGVDILWGEKGKLPEYYILLGGLLQP